MSTLRRRLLGLAFFLVVILFFVGTITKFNQGFQSFTDVTLMTDSTGNALPDRADVKARGMEVGEVRSVEQGSDGEVKVILGLKPDLADRLPAGTTARILPKTLFGERYVALQVPKDAGSERLRSGSVIQTDTSGNAMEITQLFDKLLPVLKAIPPQDLNVTLTALSRALQGRGDQLHTTIGELNTIFSRVNQNMPELQGTLRGLAGFSQTYSQALPDIIDALDNLRTTSNTIVERQGDLRTLISTLSVTAVDADNLLRRNRNDLIDLVIQSEPLLVGLAKQSPVFGCTFKNFAGLVPEAHRIVGDGTQNPGVRVNLTFVNPRGRYLPNQDEPRIWDLHPPARCYEPARNGRPFPQYPGGGVADGSYQPPSRNAGPRNLPNLPQPQFSGMPAGTIRDNAYENPAFLAKLRSIYGAASGADPNTVPAWITAIGGGSLQGAQVTIR